MDCTSCLLVSRLLSIGWEYAALERVWGIGLCMRANQNVHQGQYFLLVLTSSSDRYETSSFHFLVVSEIRHANRALRAHYIADEVRFISESLDASDQLSPASIS